MVGKIGQQEAAARDLETKIDQVGSVCIYVCVYVCIYVCMWGPKEFSNFPLHKKIQKLSNENDNDVYVCMYVYICICTLINKIYLYSNNVTTNQYRRYTMFSLNTKSCISICMYVSMYVCMYSDRKIYVYSNNVATNQYHRCIILSLNCVCMYVSS